MDETPLREPEPASPKYTKRDMQSEQEVRWCPGCGDYAILNAVQQVFARLGIPRENLVVVSGIGCSSRFPYYMGTYGFHGIHGRAPGIATGIKAVNPALQVWVVTGDGDGLSIGGNHLMHALRRNVDLKILLFNNRIYGLTKGQFSPTSELGKVSKSTPYGTIEPPLNPVAWALAAEATFVARSVDIYARHLMDILERMAKHRGAAFLEILQNCIVFNDKAHEPLVDRASRDRLNLLLEHGKPLVFGANRDLGIRFEGLRPVIVRVGEGGVAEPDLARHDEGDAAMASLIARILPPPTAEDLERTPESLRFPMPLGVFRCGRRPTFDERLEAQGAAAKASRGEGDLDRLFRSGEVWRVE
jgi:2-oxoglutarate ferredoxin oxidoreductase subunit beta